MLPVFIYCMPKTNSTVFFVLVPATPLKLEVETGDHRLQLLHANKTLLREEIDPLTLLEAFSKRGLDHFKKIKNRQIFGHFRKRIRSVDGGLYKNTWWSKNELCLKEIEVIPENAVDR